MKKKQERWYFETSGFNYLLETINFDVFIGTRELQKKRDRELLVSPVTLWEIMLTSEEPDFLIFSASNFFDKKLLATPTELLIRYLKFAYPENKINYSIYTELEIGVLWSKMTTDNSINFAYDQDLLKNKTNLIRKISKKLPSILENSESIKTDEYLLSISELVNTYYDCLKEDNFLPETIKYDRELLFKLVILFVLILFVFKLDLISNASDTFWKEANIENDNPKIRLNNFFEKYPLIFKRGPFLEMAIMAYNQVKLGKTNRGLILDCYHMIYAPYVNRIVTGDKGFANLKKNENRYSQKILHVSELKFRRELYFRNGITLCNLITTIISHWVSLIISTLKKGINYLKSSI